MPVEHAKNHDRRHFDITSLESFKEVTKEPRQIAGLYFLSAT